MPKVNKQSPIRRKFAQSGHPGVERQDCFYEQNIVENKDR
jgi:hypothetical protein